MILTDMIEGILRGGAAAICLVMVIQLLAPRPLSAAAIYGAMFALGAGIFSVVALPTISQAMGPAIFPFKLIALSTPAWFWLFVRALHDDGYRFVWRDLVPPAFLGSTYVVCTVWPSALAASMWISLGVVTALMAHTIHVVRCCVQDDLVASRRHLSRVLAWLIPLVAVSIIGIELVEIANMTLEGGAPVWARMAVACGLLGVAAVLHVTMSAIRETLLPTQTQPNFRTSRRVVDGPAAADRIDLGRLRDLMEGGAYMSAGLTIGELAGQLNLPEHRLRKLINQSLGYRNFANFVGDYRIDEAKRRLSAADMVHTQITNVAYDVGYASLAPFNRAFRERTGLSPTEYREQALAELALRPAP